MNDINPEDLLIETYRSGRFVTWHDNGVRITHKPTGIKVAFHDEKSLLKNKEKCLHELAHKLSEDDMNEGGLGDGRIE